METPAESPAGETEEDSEMVGHLMLPLRIIVILTIKVKIRVKK